MHMSTHDVSKDPITDKSMDTTKVQLDKSTSFIGVTYRSKGEGFLTKEEMIQRQLID